MNTDHQAIERLMAEYCFRIDAGDLAGFADLFKHGTWTVVGHPTGGDTGVEEVLETLQTIILYEGTPKTKHVMSNVQIDVAPGEQHATAKSYVTVFQAVPPDFPLQAIFSGGYSDKFEKVNGEWLFREREIAPDLMGDLSHHRRDMG